jgi:hypothetical protein
MGKKKTKKKSESVYVVKNGWPYKLYKKTKSEREAKRIKEKIIKETEYDAFYRKKDGYYYVYVSLHPKKVVKGIL